MVSPSNVTTNDVKYIAPLLKAFVVKSIIHDGYETPESEEEKPDEDVQ